MTVTKPRTEWWDADNRLIIYPSRVMAIFMGGLHAGMDYVDCRVNHPPVIVEHHDLKYQRDDAYPRLTYRLVTA